MTKNTLVSRIILIRKDYQNLKNDWFVIQLNILLYLISYGCKDFEQKS